LQNILEAKNSTQLKQKKLNFNNMIGSLQIFKNERKKKPQIWALTGNLHRKILL